MKTTNDDDLPKISHVSTRLISSQTPNTLICLADATMSPVISAQKTVDLRTDKARSRHDPTRGKEPIIGEITDGKIPLIIEAK